MRRTLLQTVVVAIALPAVTFALAAAGQGQSQKAPYPRMAPLRLYLSANRDAETALARSAAPKAISAHATVLFLGTHGYETVAHGTNGFTCLVERSWMSPFDAPEFWNPKIRGPICYNPPASQSILPYTLERTKLVLARLTKSQMLAQIQSLVAKHELPMPEMGSMSYMLSKGGYLADGAGPWRPHLMFHVPKTNSALWGADIAGSPVLTSAPYTLMPEPEEIFMVPVGRWSDGSSAPPI